MPSHNDITGAAQQTKAATKEFLAGHERIFGNKPIERGTWVQDKETGEFITKGEQHRRQNLKPMIYVDNMPAYESPITGEVIDSRSKRDRDLKQNGCRPYEGFKSEKREADQYHSEKDASLSGAMRETVHKHLYEIEHGYR